MILVDSSVWIDLLRDRSGQRRKAFRAATEHDDVVLSRWTQLELLQGARDEADWSLLQDYLEGQDYLEADAATWAKAARTWFDLRRRGLTVRSPIDCCIAQVALDHGAPLLHRDRDFEAIAAVRPLSQRWLAWEA